MSPFRILGLKKGATIPEIKRAYAAKLKLTRPDDDPAGFQRLREAFQSALDDARDRDRKASMAVGAPCEHDVLSSNDDAEQTPSTDPQIAITLLESTTEREQALATENDASAVNIPSVLGSPPQRALELPEPIAYDHNAPAQDNPAESFHYPTFIDDLQRAGDGDLATFERWLFSHEALYSLTLKENLAWPLMDYFSEAERPLLPKWFAALVSFFGLDKVGSRPIGLDSLVESARRHSETYWLPESVAYRFTVGGHVPSTERLAFRELKGPKNVMRRLFMLLFPGLQRDTIDLAQQFSKADPAHQARVVDPASVRFWAQVGDPFSVNRWRMASIAIQMALCALAVRLLVGQADALFATIAVVMWLLWFGTMVNRARLHRKLRDEGPTARASWSRYLGWAIIAFAILRILIAISNA